MKKIGLIFLFYSISHFAFSEYALALPDLTPYKPSGWSYKIVARTTTGCTSASCNSGSTFTTSDTIYINWAVVNSGLSNINTTFYTRLYIDGSFKKQWYTSSLPANYYTSVTDYNIGTLSSGNHTIEIRTDTSSAISESNENNNSYSFTLNVSGLPDLTPYKPSGWTHKIVARTTTGCTSASCTSNSSFTTADTIYINWAVVNSGSSNINTTFYTRLYIDGSFKKQWYTSSLPANYYTSVTDYNIGTLSSGNHTIEIRTDTSSAISESNENNNSYSFTLNVSGLPDLTPYKPSGWTHKIVARTTTGCTSASCTSNSSFTTADTIYINWAVINSGLSDINTTFYTSLYIDGSFKQSWYNSSLSANYYTSVTDYNIGTLSSGNHTIEIRTDTSSAISESNENNNSYSFTLNVSGLPDLTPYKPSGWTHKIVARTTTGCTSASCTSNSSFTTADTIYINWAVINSGLSDINTTFYTSLYIDGSFKQSWYNSSLSANYYTYATDYDIGTLSSGNHTIEIRTDATSAITESNEGNNSYDIVISIVGVEPDIRVSPTTLNF